MRKRKQDYAVKLRKKERDDLAALSSKGQVKVRVYKRAGVLVLADEGKCDREIIEAVGVSNPTVKRIRKAFVTGGLKAALEDAPRQGRPSIFDGKSRARITALACTQAPEGYSQWSLRLLADKAIELKLVEDISHTQVAQILKKTNSRPTKSGNGVLPR
jgi:putative transposase